MTPDTKKLLEECAAMRKDMKFTAENAEREKQQAADLKSLNTKAIYAKLNK